MNSAYDQTNNVVYLMEAVDLEFNWSKDIKEDDVFKLTMGSIEYVKISDKVFNMMTR